MIQQLHHPHVVQFLGSMLSAQDGAPMLVTEFMEHGSLADWFRKPTSLSDRQALEMCVDCCRGMTYLHGRTPNPVSRSGGGGWGGLVMLRASRG